VLRFASLIALALTPRRLMAKPLTIKNLQPLKCAHLMNIY